MTRFIVPLVLSLSLSACVDGTNPFDEEVTDDAATTAETDAAAADENPITSNTTNLPGTVSPTSTSTIVRREVQSGTGDGYAEGYRYDSATNTFFVDNIAFDGEGGYTAVANGSGQLGIGPFNAFENEASVVDSLSATSINQLGYRALYAIAPDGNSSIAIVRSGSYIQYGFGGFIYERNGGVTIPTTGQAIYSNPYTGANAKPNYGGLRDFNQIGRLEYVTGEMEVIIDFDDFNDGAAVKAEVSNRRVYDINNVDITSDILAAYNASPSITTIPSLKFVIEPGVLDANGELKGTVAGVEPSTETGSYYAVLSGENAATITGIIVVTSSDPRADFGTVRETGGFFAVRQ